MEAARRGARRHRRRERGRRQCPARVHERLAAVEDEAAAASATASSGTVRKIRSASSSTASGIGIGARAGTLFPGSAAVRSSSRLATAVTCQPARANAAPSAVPTRPAPTKPSRGLPSSTSWSWCVCGCSWSEPAVLVVGARVLVVGASVLAWSAHSRRIGVIVGERARRILGQSTYRDPRRAHPPGAAQPCQMLAGTRRPGTHEIPSAVPDPFSSRSTLTRRRTASTRTTGSTSAARQISRACR